MEYRVWCVESGIQIVDESKKTEAPAKEAVGPPPELRLSCDDDLENLDSCSFPLDRYSPKQFVFRTETARVIRCADLVMGNDVRLVVLSPIDEKSLKIWLDEVRSVGGIRNDRIFNVVDYGTTDDGTRFMVFEEPPGRRMSEEVQAERKSDAQTVLKLFVELCDLLSSLMKESPIPGKMGYIGPGSIVLPTIDSTSTEFQIADWGASIWAGVEVTGADCPPGASDRNWMSEKEAIYLLGSMLRDVLSREEGGEEALFDVIAEHYPEVDAVIKRCTAEDPGERPASLDKLKFSLMDLVETVRYKHLSPTVYDTGSDGSSAKSKVDALALYIAIGALLFVLASSALVLHFSPWGYSGSSENLIEEWQALPQPSSEDVKETQAQPIPTPPAQKSIPMEPWMSDKIRIEDNELIFENANLDRRKIQLFSHLDSEYISFSNCVFDGASALSALSSFPKAFVISFDGSRGLTDEAMKSLARIDRKTGKPLMQSISTISLKNTDVTGEGLEKLAALPGTLNLYLEGTRIDDDDLRSIARLHLHLLDLRRTNVTDRGLATLYGQKDLRIIQLETGDDVSTEAIDRLKSRLPECDVQVLPAGKGT